MSEEAIITLRRQAIIDEYTCERCRALDGTILTDVWELITNCDHVERGTGICRCTAAIDE